MSLLHLLGVDADKGHILVAYCFGGSGLIGTSKSRLFIEILDDSSSGWTTRRIQIPATFKEKPQVVAMHVTVRWKIISSRVFTTHYLVKNRTVLSKVVKGGFPGEYLATRY